MCHRCLDLGVIRYGAETVSGQREVSCGCAYRGRSPHRPDRPLVGSASDEVLKEKSRDGVNDGKH